MDSSSPGTRLVCDHSRAVGLRETLLASAGVMEVQEGGSSSLSDAVAVAAVVKPGSARRDFGSFHSSNVQETINLADDDYQAPLMPIELPTFTERVAFGTEMKEYFFVDKSWILLNHAHSFGAVMKEALQVGLAWQIYCEKQPLRFLDRELIPHLVYVSRRIASFVDADPEDMVLIPDLAMGMNTVVQCLAKSFKRGESVLCLSTASDSTKTLLQHMCVEQGIRVTEVALTFPLKSTQQIVQLVKETLRDDTRLAIFEHIPSITMPIKDLVSLCQRRGVEVLVDGAHALGSLPISIRQIGADYYTFNVHKWFCSAEDCAFLFVGKKHQPKIRPLVVSHGFGSGFSSEFIWTGLRDYSSYLALHTALDFWEAYGVDNMRSYINETAKCGALKLQEAWGTRLLSDISQFGPVVLVAIPEGINQMINVEMKEMSLSSKGEKGDSEKRETGRELHCGRAHAEIMQNKLYKFKMEVPVVAVQGKLYVRVTAHVYNSPEDYQQLADVVLQLAGLI